MDYRNRFPMLINNPDIVYFDNGALALKPDVVCQAGNDFYTKYSISTRTKDSKLGMMASNYVNDCRNKLAKLVDADPKHVIFSSGCTESLNQLAMMIKDVVSNGDEILISLYNHASNILPFFYYLQFKNVKFEYFTSQEDLLKKINKNTKLVCLSQITNNINVSYDLDIIYKKCLEVGAFLINDAAQAIAYKKVSINNCDAITMSANKFYGPTGLGASMFSKRLFKHLKPKKFGGGAYKFLSYDDELDSQAFEPGTQNLAGIYQFNAALDFVNSIGTDIIYEKLRSLSTYLHKKLSALDNVDLISKAGDVICLFNIKHVASQDVASYLGSKQIYVRSGTFCAYLLKNYTESRNTYVRVSLGFYNNFKDIDKLIEALKNGGDFLDYI